MKNVGSVLREAREAKNKTLKQISQQTKIKEKFLSALEIGDWNSLPDFAITQGFARTLAQVVDADPRLVVALLRRDYPTIHKPQVYNEMSLEKSSLWTPKMTILVVVGGTFLVLSFYLIKQYFTFVVPPSLKVEKVKVEEKTVEVSGKTNPTATIEINGRPVLVDNNGRFVFEIEKQDLINSQVEIKAISRTGKTTIVRKSISN